MFAEKPQREQNQVVEIHGVAGVQGGFVTLADMLGQCADAFVGKSCRAFAAVLELAQHRQNGGRVGFFAFGRNARKGFS